MFGLWTIIQQCKGHNADINIKQSPTKIIIQEPHISTNEPDVHFNSQYNQSGKRNVSRHNVADKGKWRFLCFVVVYAVVAICAEKDQSDADDNVKNF